MARCKRFSNTSVVFGARKYREGYRGHVTCIEFSAWTTPCRYTKHSEIVRLSRADALLDAERAASGAVETGYIPAF
jgi:hypothetical protein